jgi:WD40 repeat protein
LTVGASLVRVFEISPDDEAAPEKLLWDSRALPTDLNDRRARVKSASFGPDSRSLLVMMEDDTANVHAVDDGRLLVREQKVNDAAFIADGRTIAFGTSSADQGWVRVRALHTSDPRRLPAVRLPDGMRTVRDVAFSPDGRLALVAGKGAQLYRTQTWEPVGEPLPHEWEIIKASFSPDGRTVVTSMWGPRPGLIGTSPGRLRFWDAETGEQIGEPIPLERFGSPLVFDATGEILLAGEWLCKIPTLELIERRSLEVGADERTVQQLVSHRPDSRMPPLWDFEKDEPTRLRMPEDDVVAARLTPDAQRLLTTRRDGSSRLWAAETGEPLGPRFRAEGYLRKVSPDGKSAVFVGRTYLRLWDPYTGRPRGESLINQQANVSSAFSPSGEMLATLWHWTAQLRDSGTGQALTPLLAQPTSGGGAVLFTPNGQELLVLSHGVQRWRVPTPAADEPERLKLSVEIRTGLEIDENGVIQTLTRTEWLERKRRLEQIGGPCDVAER